MIELDIGSECGGHGICGKDRLKLQPASQALVSPPTDEERAHLSMEELTEGWRLGCQCFPEKSGVEIVAVLSSGNRP
jgi:ferredoxin